MASSIGLEDDSPGQPGQRRALLVCNGELTFVKLPGVKRDFEAMTALLGDPEIGGFTVTGLLDRGLLEVRRAIAQICHESGAADTLLIYYSGGSFRDEAGDFYLPVVDSDREHVDATAVDADFVLSRIRRSKCRRVVILIDGCDSGAFFNNNRGIPDGLMAITACAADQQSEDTPEGGAFTRALCAALTSPATDKDGDGMLSVDEVHAFAQTWLKQQGFRGSPQKWVWNVQEPIFLASSPLKVFISYCRADVAIAEQLKQALEAQGFSVWLDLEGIQSGDWKQRVTDGLNRARALVFIMTPASMRSDAAQKELAFATAKGVPIVPITVGPLDRREIPDWYAFDYGPIHRRTLDLADPGPDLEALGKAIRDAKRRPAAT